MHVKINNMILGVFALLFFLSCLQGNLVLAEDSQLVAEVYGSKIFMSDLLASVRKELGTDYDSFSKQEQHVLLTTMMEKLIERKILLKEAEDSKFTPTPETVEAFIASLDRQLGNTSTVRKELEKHGAEEAEFKKRLLEELAIKEYLDRRVFSGINVTGKDIEDELAKNADKYKVSKEVCARYVELKIPKDSSPEQLVEIEKKAKAALALVQDNREFSDVAREFSEASNRSKGGDLGCFTENQLPSEFTKVAFGLAEGKVSEVFRAPNAFMFVKVDKIKQPPDLTPAEKKERAEQVLLRAEREKLLAAALERLKKGAKVIRYFH